MFTNSTKFLLPFLKLDGRILQALGFINTYIDDASKPKHYKNCIYLYFNPKDKEELKNYVLYLDRHHTLFNDIYPVEDGYILVFNFPDKNIMEKFIQGKYSQFDKKYIGNGKIFPRDVIKNGIITVSEIWRILTRDPNKRIELEKHLAVDIPKEAELWDIPSIKNETFRFNELNIRTNQILSEESV